MNPGSVVRKRLRTWLPWLVHSFVLTVLLIQLMPAATQAQNGDDNMLFLPAAAGGTHSNNPSSSEVTDSLGDWLPPVEGEIIEIVEASETMAAGDLLPPVEGETIEIVEASETMSADTASIDAISSTYLADLFIGNQFNQTARVCTEFTLPADIINFDGGRIRFILQHETSSTDEIRSIDYIIGLETFPGNWGSNDNYGGRSGWARAGVGSDRKFILDDGVRHTVAAPWGWATVTDYNPQNNVIETGDDLWFCSHPYVYSRIIFYAE